LSPAITCCAIAAPRLSLNVPWLAPQFSTVSQASAVQPRVTGAM
jgi:hypothetical protein